MHGWRRKHNNLFRLYPEGCASLELVDLWCVPYLASALHPMQRKKTFMEYHINRNKLHLHRQYGFHPC